jgi:hypothetical protein
LRIAESLGEAEALCAEVKAWRSGWAAIAGIGGHRVHLALLCSTVLGLTGKIAAHIAAIDPAMDAGIVYDECRREDVRLMHARRLWRWYADKLDQRSLRDDPVTQTLLAADEVMLSCWSAAFAALGETPPAAPLPYLSLLYSASATPRTDPPADLRPGRDDLLLTLVGRLPIAAVGLPPVCCRRPWWLILGAHEASHHVQFESAGLEELTREKVVGAAYRAVEDVELSEAWEPWCRELFADACSVLLVGSAAIWAVSELETRTEPGLRKSPSGSYPPPLIRLAVMRAVASAAGMPTVDYVAASSDADDRLGRLLACVPEVAEALIGLKSPADGILQSLAAATAAAYTSDGSVAAWASDLLGTDEPRARQEPDAARFCVAGGVDAWRQSGGQDGVASRLAVRLRTLLPACHPTGKRAIRPAPDAGTITDQLVRDLYLGPSGRLL